MALVSLDSLNGECIGKHQIPFMFNRNIIKKELKPIVFKNFDKLPNETILENDSHKVIMKMKYGSEDIPTIEMGPLEGIGKYRFDSIYFQWFRTNVALYDSTSLNVPPEMHVLFYDTKYASLNEAMGHKNSIAILAFGFKLKLRDSYNPKYDGLQQNLKHVNLGYDKTTIENRALEDWVTTKMMMIYFAYNGSLLTHDCDIEVLWIDFFQPIEINDELNSEFLLLKTHDRKRLVDQAEFVLTPNDSVVLPLNSFTNDSDWNVNLLEMGSPNTIELNEHNPNSYITDFLPVVVIVDARNSSKSRHIRIEKILKLINPMTLQIYLSIVQHFICLIKFKET